MLSDADRQAVAARAEEAREQSARLGRMIADQRAVYMKALARCLDTRTWMLDAGRPSLHTLPAVERLSMMVGRDPGIEQAKSIVAARFGITRGQAFEVLVKTSQNSNRKVRDVAHRVVTEQQAHEPKDEKAWARRAS